MSKHTPGPWTEDPEGEFYVSVEGPDGKVICNVHLVDESHSNARLIAKAPELLEVLRKAREIINWVSISRYEREACAEDIANIDALIDEFEDAP